MTDYISQKDSYSCVPVAIANACIWAGTQDNPQELVEQLRVVCRTDADKKTRTRSIKERGGTSKQGCADGIASRNELVVAFEKTCPSIKDIKWHLDKGGSVLLCYKNWKVRNNGHACFIDKRDKNNYHIVNGGESTSTTCWRSNTKLRKFLARKATYGHKPHAWFFFKREDYDKHYKTWEKTL